MTMAAFAERPVIPPTLLRRFLAGTRRVSRSCSACPCHRAVASSSNSMTNRASLRWSARSASNVSWRA